MKFPVRPRAQHASTGSTNRSGLAALVIGGLVAGTVATAGAVTLDKKPVAGATAADLSDVVRDEVPTTTLSSDSLEELRAQDAADRSEARTAPKDADQAETILEQSAFTGETIEVEAPAEPEQTEAVAAEEPAPVEQEQQAEPQQEAAPQQESAAQATQTQATQQAAPAPVGGSLLDIAASYVGYPYVLYGTPPSSFDCSAYTWWVFQQAGIDIPRTVAGQRGAVTPVSNPQPGDLVFYNDWHHVGIYAGNGMTYEALNPSTDVRYGPLLSTNVWYGRIG